MTLDGSFPLASTHTKMEENPLDLLAVIFKNEG